MRIHPLQLSRHSSSLGVIVDSHLPHLICMDDDILSTGVVMYYLQVRAPQSLLYVEDVFCLLWDTMVVW